MVINGPLNIGAVKGAGAIPLRAGEVVLAKYQGTSRTRFYWAKVTKVYTSGNQARCDVSWLRPQAGTPGGAAYVLHDGHDETQRGDGLDVSTEVRRPCPEDLTHSAPPGAVASASPHQAAKNSHVQSVGSKHEPLKTINGGADFSDLLGDVLAESREGKDPLMNVIDLTRDGSQVNHSWANFESRNQAPYMTNGPSMPQATQQAAPWSLSTATIPTAGYSFLQQGMQSRSLPAAMEPVKNKDTHFAFVSDLLPNSSSSKKSQSKQPRTNDGSFNFISDMVSDALRDVKP